MPCTNPSLDQRKGVWQGRKIPSRHERAQSPGRFASISAQGRSTLRSFRSSLQECCTATVRKDVQGFPNARYRQCLTLWRSACVIWRSLGYETCRFAVVTVARGTRGYSRFPAPGTERAADRHFIRSHRAITERSFGASALRANKAVRPTRGDHCHQHSFVPYWRSNSG